MMMCNQRLRVLLGLVLFLVPATSGAGLMDPPPKPWVAPGRLFSFNLPPHWQVIENETPYEFQFKPAGPGDPVLFIRRIQVPPGANPRQMALRSLDDRLNKLPQAKVLAKRTVTLAGHPATNVVVTYAFQGNIQYPRVVEQVHVVVGDEGFIFHFDCFTQTAERYSAALNTIYQSFIPRPADSSGVFDTDEENFPQVEKIPF